MALNITFDGFVHLNNNNLAGDTVKYQGLFYPNGTASSPTKWNNVRITESSSYYNINLGDGDWLTQDGSALTGAKVLIVFWVGDTLDRNSLCLPPNNLIEWGVLEITLDGSSVYTNTVQVRTNIDPNVDWSLRSNGLVGDSYIVTNNSDDEHSWVYNGVELLHTKHKYGEDIQLINNIVSTSYYWGDGTSDENLPGTANASHVWTSAGSYDVKIVVKDECGDTTEDTKTIEIRNKAPIPNIECLQTSTNNISIPDTIVTFRYNGTDPNDKITSIDWTIHDSGIYGNTDTTLTAFRDDTVPHSSGLGTNWCSHSATVGAFTNPGDHKVSIVVHWFDGFNNLTINYDEVFVQERFSGPLVDFDQTPPLATISGTVTFRNETTNYDRVGTGPPHCYKYDWKYYDSGNLVEEQLDVNRDYLFTVNPVSTNSVIELCANWNDGWENKNTCIDKFIVFKTEVTVKPEDCYYIIDINGTSPDGSIDGYRWEIYQDTTISGGTGPWKKIWDSPLGIEQKTKKIGFTDLGYFKVKGFIYGNNNNYTFDEEILYVYEVCPAGVSLVVWDGTGILDTGSDWTRTGSGFEASYAAHGGTNGLDASSLDDGDSIVFIEGVIGVNVNNYESFTMWVNMRYVPQGSDLDIRLDNVGFGRSDTLKLSNYVNISKTNEWQKVIINLDDFNIPERPVTGHPKYVNRVNLIADGRIGFYLDDVSFSASYVERFAVQVCTVDMTSDEVGIHTIKGNQMIPNVRGKFDKETSDRIVNTFPKPKLT